VARICVFCASSQRVAPRYLRLAELVGAELAGRGHHLVSGCGRHSMMGALARAARAAGGHTLGVIPELFMGVGVEDAEVDELEVTADLHTRKHRMIQMSDAFLALPGGLGTLDELLEVWVGRDLGEHPKPVVVLDPDGVFTPLRDLVTALGESGFVLPTAVSAVTWTSAVGEALDAVEAALATDARLPVAPRGRGAEAHGEMRPA